jgi:uncharacterized protein YpmS
MSVCDILNIAQTLSYFILTAAILSVDLIQFCFCATLTVCCCPQVLADSEQKSASNKNQESDSRQVTTTKGRANETMTKTVNSSMGKLPKTI